MADEEDISFEQFAEIKKFDDLNCFSDSFPLVKLAGHYLFAHLPTIWPNIQRLNVRESDIMLIVYAKCGTHWLYYMVYMMLTKNFGRIPEHQQRPLLEMQLAETLDKMNDYPSPRIFPTHLPVALLPRTAFKAKTIYVYRNPKDLVVSSFHHYVNMAVAWPCDYTFEQIVRRFMRGETWFGPYPKHLRDAWEAKQQGKEILFVCYDNVKRDTRGSLKRIADFLGLEGIDDQVLDKVIAASSVEAMRSNQDANGHNWRKSGIWKKEEPFVRKGIVGDWRNHFTDKQLLAEFDQWVADNIPPQFLPEGYE